MKKPNILFFFPDQHRPDYLGTTPDLPVRTPNLDALEARGMRFTNAVCPSPLCAPSRASLAAGKHYHRCGVPQNKFDYPLDQPTYYKMLRDNGYHVVGVGKFDLQKGSAKHSLDGKALLPEWGFSDGYDIKGKWGFILETEGQPLDAYALYLQEHGLLETHMRDFAQRRGTDHYGYRCYDPTPLPGHAYSDNWVANQALELLNQFPTDRPWHLVLNFTGPHDPLDVTESMQANWRDVEFPPPHNSTEFDHETHQRIRRNYAAMIENIDYQVGRLIEAVSARGELDNTLIIYASDHGEMLGDHNHWAKALWYHQSMGIPLIIAGPGVQSGVVSTAPVNLIDLSATYLDYANIPTPAEMDAQSLRPILSGKTEAHRSHVICGLSHPAMRWPRRWHAIYDGRYKLVAFDDAQEPADLLYDRHNDPHEDHNIAAQCPAVVEHLYTTLQAELA